MSKFSLYTMTVLYVAAGINHFVNPAIYQKIMPPWLPEPRLLIYISGICEVVFALLLLFPATRILGAWCIIGLLVAVFPANIQMMLQYAKANSPWLWLAILRLPLQGVLVWWAYTFTKPVVGA
jgi:uncharacterized membrane protein